MSLSKHRCDVCDLSFTSYQHYSIHLGGLLHKEKQRKKLEAQDDFVQGPSGLNESATYPRLSSKRYSYDESASAGLRSCLKQPKSSAASLSDAAAATTSQRRHYSNAAVALPHTDSMLSSHFSLAFEFPSSRRSIYQDSSQLDKTDANGFESYSSQELHWREEQNADKVTDALTKPLSSSSKRCSNDQSSSILTLLAAQRLLQDSSLEEEPPKRPPKAEGKSKDSVRTLLSAQFDLLKSYMTEPQKPVKASETEKVKTSPGQDFSRLKAVGRSDANLSTMVGSTPGLNVQIRHPLEAADQYSTKADQSMGLRLLGAVKTTLDFWSRQATYADGVQNDPSSIPFLDEGGANDGCVPEIQASSVPHSLNRVSASTWDRNEDSFGACQRSRSSDAKERTHTDKSKRDEPKRSVGSVSDRTWPSRGLCEVKSIGPSDAWKQREDKDLKSAERTYNDELQHDPNLNYFKTQLGKPVLSSENETYRATVASQRHKSAFRDNLTRPLSPLNETNQSQLSIEDFMARVKKNLQRDLKYDSLPTSAGRTEEKTDFGRSYPVTPLLQSNMAQRKVLLQTPSSSKSVGASFDISMTTSASKRKILLPTPVAAAATPQSSATSLPSSSTGTAWSQPDGRERFPSQQQPRFTSSACGGSLVSSVDSYPSLSPAGKNLPPPVLQSTLFNPGGRSQNDSTFSGSTTVSSTAKKTLLSMPPVSCLQRGSSGRNSSTAGPLNSAKVSFSQALSGKPLPVTRSVVADKPQSASGKLEAISTCGSEKTSSESEEVDPQLKLQKEIEVVMAERVEDLMRVIPDSMMRSIMDGKVPLEFLDKISDLIPTEVIEKAVKQREQSVAETNTTAGSDHTQSGISQRPLLKNQTVVAAAPGTGQGSGDGVQSRSGWSKIEKPYLECTAVTEKVNLGGQVELVKKMIDEILGDLANEAGAPSDTDVLEKLAPKDRSLVLEMQDVAGIRDVSVIIEILQFFKTLDRSLILTLSKISEKEEERGQSMLRQMTKAMLKYDSKHDSNTSCITGEKRQNLSPTHNSGIMTKTGNEQSLKFEIENAGLGNFVQPCVTNSSLVSSVYQDKVVAVKKPELQSMSAAPKSNFTVLEKQIVKGSTVVAQNKNEIPEIKALSIPLSAAHDFKTFSSPAQYTAGPVKKPETKAPAVLTSNRGSISEPLGSKSSSYTARNLNVVAKNPETKAALFHNQNNNIDAEKTSQCAPQNRARVTELSSPDSKVVASSVATLSKSELQVTWCNPQHKVVTVPVEKQATVGVRAVSERSNISQKTVLAVAGQPELKETFESSLGFSSSILKTPEAKSSAIQQKSTSSDRLEKRVSSEVTQSKTETTEKPDLKIRCRAAENMASSEETMTTSDIQQTTTATVAASMDTLASLVVVEQSKITSTGQIESGRQATGSLSGLPLTQPCSADKRSEEQTSLNGKAEKRKAAQSDEPNKKVKLQTASAVVSATPAATVTASTVTGLQLKARYVAPVCSTVGQGPRRQFPSPRQAPPQQSVKPRSVLLPTPDGLRPRPVPLLSPRLDVRHKQPLLRSPFPPRDLSFQRPQLPRAGLEAPALRVQPLMPPAHRQLRPPPHELLHPAEATLNMMPRIRARAPPPRLMQMQRPVAPFGARNCTPMKVRSLLQNPNLHQRPPLPLVFAGDSFHLPGPKLDIIGPPPFKRWR